MSSPSPAPGITTPRLAVQELTRVFIARGRRTVALENLSFHILPGETVALVGPSGCGKSTLLSILAGLDRPTSGRVLLDGAPLGGPSAERGMVFQRDCLFPWLSVRDNVRYVMKLEIGRGSPSHVEQMVERSNALIEAVGLAGFAEALPHELSGGMRQRAAIARALLFQPRVLMLDEPFGALDAQTREGMQDLLLGLTAKHKTTSLFVTHDVEEAVYVADRVVVLAAHPGRVVAEVPIPLGAGRTQRLKLGHDFHQLRAAVLEPLHASTTLSA